MLLLILKNSHFGLFSLTFFHSLSVFRSIYCRRHSNIEEISTSREEVLSGRINNVLMNERVLSPGWHHLLRQTKADGMAGVSAAATPPPIKKSAAR